MYAPLILSAVIVLACFLGWVVSSKSAWNDSLRAGIGSRDLRPVLPDSSAHALQDSSARALEVEESIAAESPADDGPRPGLASAVEPGASTDGSSVPAGDADSPEGSPGSGAQTAGTEPIAAEPPPAAPTLDESSSRVNPWFVMQ